MQEIISKDIAGSLGLKKFFTGIPCANGHIAPRYVNGGSCVFCIANHRVARRLAKPDEVLKGKRDWASRNKKRGRATKVAWVTSNRDRVNAQARDAYQRNRATILERAASYRAANREKVSIGNRFWRQANPSYASMAAKKWRTVNPESARVFSHYYRARKRNTVGTHTAGDIKYLLLGQKWRCAYCQRKVRDDYHIDHIVPLSKGGSNDKYNLQICCPSCNLRKHAKDPIDFAQELGLLL